MKINFGKYFVELKERLFYIMDELLRDNVITCDIEAYPIRYKLKESYTISNLDRRKERQAPPDDGIEYGELDFLF